MWKFLYQLSSPRFFYNFSGNLLPYFKLLCCITLGTGIIWGLFFVPADYQQGDAFRIIYIHVPTAFLALAIYAGMGFLAFLFLIWRIKLAGIILRMCAPIGASMALIALVTGSLWGKPMWGAWWIWDARLTSELILLFIYLALIFLGQAHPEKAQSDKMVAILTLVGLIDLPIIHYSVYWWNTLHQGSTLTIFSKPKIATSMLYPLLICILGFGCYCIVLVLTKARTELLRREYKQQWVMNLLAGRTEQ